MWRHGLASQNFLFLRAFIRLEIASHVFVCINRQCFVSPNCSHINLAFADRGGTDETKTGDLVENIVLL